MYYDTANRRAYYWTDKVIETSVNTVERIHLWEELQNADTINALESASHAQAAVDGKIRFFSTPIPPYDPGDIWVQGSNGGFYVCTKARAQGENFSQSDWERATGYTDDTRANEAAKTATDYIQSNGNGTHYGPTGQSNGVTVRGNSGTGGLQFDGIRNAEALWTNGSANSGTADGFTILTGETLKSFSAVAIGFKEKYTNKASDDLLANEDELQYWVVPLNGQETICARAWDIQRIRKVTAYRDGRGIVFGPGGYYDEAHTIVGLPYCRFVKNNKCCVPYIVYGFM